MIMNYIMVDRSEESTECFKFSQFYAVKEDELDTTKRITNDEIRVYLFYCECSLSLSKKERK